ncbi:MAG: ferritin-like domain-containing protein [Bacteroidetes bacterium]|nr:ferritin-like domain-containing protein [Bacteroidota bacterium]
MNLFNIIQKIGEESTSKILKMPGVDPINTESRLSSNVLKSSFGNRSAITDVLNFALTLEYLESAYYNQGVASGVIPSADLTVFQQIKKHENAHVSFLQSTISALGGTPVASPTFDFTAGGAFNPFYVYGDFLALSQAFEDTGVRAYKGQAGNLISDNTVLTAALQIHSVEARHASEVRRLRNKNGLDALTKGWITANSRGTLPAATQPTYDGEENVIHGGVDATTVTTSSTAAVQEAFDEPLTDTMVLAIIQPFIV